MTLCLNWIVYSPMRRIWRHFSARSYRAAGLCVSNLTSHLTVTLTAFSKTWNPRRLRSSPPPPKTHEPHPRSVTRTPRCDWLRRGRCSKADVDRDDDDEKVRAFRQVWWVGMSRTALWLYHECQINSYIARVWTNSEIWGVLVFSIFSSGGT